MLVYSGSLFLLGLILAGLVSTLISPDKIARLARGGRVRAATKAALIGVPLPLCSCSVLPVASQLRRSGMSRAGVASFLVATPESGLDSILLTYSLTDPLLTVARPVAAFLSAFGAGIVQKEELATPSPMVTAACANTASCARAVESRIGGDETLIQRILKGIQYGFWDLLGDLAPYLLIGFLLAGLLDILFGSYLLDLPLHWKSGILGYAGAIVSGLPLYVCATSSTPLAAVLLTHGFSPGAVLVFLLVGPATNIATLVVVKSILGFRATLRYLLAIVVSAIFCGIVLDLLYDHLDIEASFRYAASHGESRLATFSAAILSLLILYHTSRKLLARLK